MVILCLLLAGLFCIVQTQQNFICPAPNGIFPDFPSTGCTQFWRCDNCFAQRGTCANGQQFDYNRRQCDRDANVQCNNQRRNFQRLPGAAQCRLPAFNPRFPPQNIPGNGFGLGGGGGVPPFVPALPGQQGGQNVIITLPAVNPAIDPQLCQTVQNQMNAFFAQIIQMATGQRCPSPQCPVPILIVQC